MPKNSSPAFFKRFVTELLVKTRYADSIREAGQAIINTPQIHLTIISKFLQL